MNNTLIIHNKHPESLKVFFSTEMWERYGFYVVQSLLALYLANHYQWPDKRVYGLVGSFTALTYLSPVAGGWIADHLLGQKKTIILGGIFLFLSYIALTFISEKFMLFAALAGIAVGTGLLKPNISSLLGNAYHEESPRRESGFTIFYMGITSGIILGTTLPSQLAHYLGWPSAFFSAAIGMLIALSVFSFGIKHYRITDYHQHALCWSNLFKTAAILCIIWFLALYTLMTPNFANMAFGLVVLASIGYLCKCARNETPKQARQTAVIGLLCTISVIFWAFYFQMFLSLTLFISRVVYPNFLGIHFPPPYYVSIQSIGMLIFGFFLSRRIPKLNSIQSGLSTGNKFLLSIVCTTLAYTLITFVCDHSLGSYLLISPLFLIPVYLLFSLAELLLSPVGLSAITILASKRKVSTMMGIFFVSLGIGAFLSGKLAYLTAVNDLSLSTLALKAHYAHSFKQLLIILLVATGCCVVINLIIHRLLLTKLPAQTQS